ncbi:MAG: iron-sulfur cluster assembly scaffold protein [Hyphomicrobium sp.]
MVELDDIYNSKLMKLAATIPHTGHLSQPDASGEAHSKLCGSAVSVEININNGRVTDFAQNVKACLLGQATASIVGQHIIGTSLEEVHSLSEQMRRMLKENGPPPTGRWSELNLLAPVRDYKHRQPSTLLIFDALERAIYNYSLKLKASPEQKETRSLRE